MNHVHADQCVVDLLYMSPAMSSIKSSVEFLPKQLGVRGLQGFCNMSTTSFSGAYNLPFACGGLVALRQRLQQYSMLLQRTETA